MMQVFLLILTTAAVTVGITLLWLNLAGGGKNIRYTICSDYGVGDPQFERTIGQLLGPPLLGGNSVAVLRNGVEIFPAILVAIREAKKTICFETYIYWSGLIGNEISDALAERAERGVTVHVLLDWVGSDRIDPALIDKMKAAGVEVERYHPPRWYNLSRMNNRTHRKLLIVDGKIGFTGGVGIADQWLGDADSAAHWRDSHFRLEGPAVAQMQAVFMDNWVTVRSKVHHTEEYFPKLAASGETLAQVFRSSAREGSESVRLMYLLSIAAAEKTILLANAYFVPDDLAVESLIAAKERGVKIEIIVPGTHTDEPLVRRASRGRWGRLLEAGIDIYEFQPTMLHCKILIVDGVWTSVGSTNFDNRSFRLNDEANLNILDRNFAEQATQHFYEDRERSERFTFEQWKQRPIREKTREFLAGLLRSQL